MRDEAVDISVRVKRCVLGRANESGEACEVSTGLMALWLVFDFLMLSSHIFLLLSL
jgi:hypothetical protein